VDGGTLEIRVQEGVVDGSAGIGGIVTSGADKRIRPEVVARVLAEGAPAGQPLDGEALERSLLVANELPGVKKIKANLAPGSQPGTTQVEAQVEEGRLVTGSVWADNYGNHYTGSGRLSVAANLNSPTGYGDLWTLTASKSSGMTSGRFGAIVPVGSRGGRVGASYSEVSMDFAGQVIPVNLDGKARVASVFASYPLHRSATSNVLLSGSYDAKSLNTTSRAAPTATARSACSPSACSATGSTASAAPTAGTCRWPAAAPTSPATPPTRCATTSAPAPTGISPRPTTP
jgi:hemolysin activation/secretion protein